MSDLFMIAAFDAGEILDSRGNPTLSVTVTLRGGIQAAASVPSGASTGLHEAVELRDGDKSRYGGKGVVRAIANVKGEISDALVGMDTREQRIIDDKLIELDGTATKSRLGGDAILGASQRSRRRLRLRNRLRPNLLVRSAAPP